MAPKFYGFAAATVLAICAGTFAQEGKQRDDLKSKSIANQLIGTWKLAETSNPGMPSGIGTRLKLFTGTHWCVIQPDADTGLIVFQHGGRYEIDGGTLSTKRDFAGESTKEMIGSGGKFKITIDGDTMKQGDPEGEFTETWKRVK